MLRRSSKANIDDLTLAPQPDPSFYKPLVIVGPSGAGKGTILGDIMAHDSFKFSVSYTTRQPRQGEQNGVHYFFVTKDEFQKMIDQDSFIEYFNVHSNFYGTTKAQIKDIQKNEKIPLLDIDVQGALKFEKAFPEANFVAIVPSSVDDLK